MTPRTVFGPLFLVFGVWMLSGVMALPQEDWFFWFGGIMLYAYDRWNRKEKP